MRGRRYNAKSTRHPCWSISSSWWPYTRCPAKLPPLLRALPHSTPAIWQDPILDSHILDTPTCIPGIVNLCNSDSVTLQMLGATMADYLSVHEPHQIMIVQEDFELVTALVQLLHAQEDQAIRRHVCQALYYISNQPHNVLSMIKEPGIVEGLISAIHGAQPNVEEPALLCLRNFAAHYDLQVHMASVTGCTEMLTSCLESKNPAVSKAAKEMMQMFSDNPDLMVDDYVPRVYGAPRLAR